MPLNVLITGANSGFGLLTARTFAEAGHVVHAGYRNPAKLAGLQALVEEGFPVHPVRIDVTDDANIRTGVAAATADAPIDVLVNNAGFEVRAPIDELSDEYLHRQFDTNVFGVIRMARAVGPAMRARRAGTIVNLSSVVGTIAIPYTGIYAASKHAVEAISEAMWFELAPFGLRVAVVAPGAFHTTGFVDNLVIDPAFGPQSAHYGNATQFGEALARLIVNNVQDPQEVADAVFQAATEPEPRFRYIVGRDAQGAIPAYRNQDFEPFAGGMLAMLGLSDWAQGQLLANSAQGTLKRETQ